MTVAEAARCHRVPYSTLWKKIHGTSKQAAIDKRRALPLEQEQAVVEYALTMKDMGKPLRRKDLRPTILVHILTVLE